MGHWMEYLDKILLLLPTSVQCWVGGGHYNRGDQGGSPRYSPRSQHSGNKVAEIDKRMNSRAFFGVKPPLIGLEKSSWHACLDLHPHQTATKIPGSNLKYHLCAFMQSTIDFKPINQNTIHPLSVVQLWRCWFYFGSRVIQTETLNEQEIVKRRWQRYRLGRMRMTCFPPLGPELSGSPRVSVSQTGRTENLPPGS